METVGDTTVLAGVAVVRPKAVNNVFTGGVLFDGDLDGVGRKTRRVVVHVQDRNAHLWRGRESL